MPLFLSTNVRYIDGIKEKEAVENTELIPSEYKDEEATIQKIERGASRVKYLSHGSNLCSFPKYKFPQ